jgi:hypothetical protein
LLTVRGVVGMPLSLSRFMALADYRNCFIQVRTALACRGFFVSPIYFEEHDLAPEELIEILKREGVDIAFWLLSEAIDRQTPSRLRDLGIRFIDFRLGEIGAGTSRYEVRRQRATKTILRDWRTDPRVDRVAIVCAEDETPANLDVLSKLRLLAEAEEIPCDTVTVPSAGIGRFFETLGVGKKIGVVLPGRAAAMLAWSGVENSRVFLERFRVALVDGPIDIPFGSAARAYVDQVTIDWSAVAGRIAGEFASGQALSEKGPTVFEAEAQLRVCLDARPE